MDNTFYSPNNYNFDYIESIGIENFIKLQNYYRYFFEYYLKKIFNFKKYVDEIYLVDKNIPIIHDEEFNCYRRYSYLDNGIFYLRNNIYIDRLSDDEKKELIMNFKNNVMLSSEFINKTFKKVLFENKNCFFNYDSLENLVEKDSLVFEFAYDISQYKNLKDKISINKEIKNIAQNLCLEIESKLKINCRYIIYLKLPIAYRNKQI